MTKPATRDSRPTATTHAPPGVAALARLIRLLPRGRMRAARLFSPYLCRQAPFIASFGQPPVQCVIDLKDFFCRCLFLEGAWEPPAAAVWAALARPGHCVVDVGAYYGHFSLIAALRVAPGGRVVAFEPNPTSRARMQDNVALNGSLPLEIEGLAVAGRQGMTCLDTASQENSSHAHVIAAGEHQGGSGTLSVPATALDAYCREKGIERVDLLKMDIEGGEADALDGMREGLAAGRYLRVLLELHPRALREMGRDPDAVVQLFRDLGYSCWSVPQRMPGPWGHLRLGYRPGLVKPYDGRMPPTPSHFLFLAKGLSLP